MDLVYDYEVIKEKIDQELKACSESKHPKVKAISEHVAKQLKTFSKNESFGLAVQGSKSKLKDCCKAIINDSKTYISDLEVYKKAVKFYFPKGDVEFSMKIIVEGSEHTIVDQKQSNKKRINISLDDLL